MHAFAIVLFNKKLGHEAGVVPEFQRLCLYHVAFIRFSDFHGFLTGIRSSKNCPSTLMFFG